MGTTRKDPRQEARGTPKKDLGPEARGTPTLLEPIYIQRRICDLAAMSLPNGLQSDSPATGNLVAVANDGCNSTTPKQQN